MKSLRDFLAQRKREHLYRQRRIAAGAQRPVMEIDGRRVVNFCSNDYLGLAADPRLTEAFRRAADECGLGSGASHLISGHHRWHHALEERLAEFTGRERALVFSTGYMANLGVIQALVGPGDAVFADRLSHASLLDGAMLSRARLTRYPHGDAEALARRLDASRAARRLVVTDGVFSMDGDVAPLSGLVQAAERHGAWLMVDDAHGIGVLGQQGGGSLQRAGLGQDEVPVLVGTFGKALGTAGAFVAGSAELIDYLVQTARPYIYTTAMPAALAAATLASLDVVAAEPERRSYLHSLVRRFRVLARELPAPLLASETPIQGLVLGSAERALAVSRRLFGLGFLVSAIRPPTVPAGSARLRITLSAAHSRSQVDDLLDALHTALAKTG